MKDSHIVRNIYLIHRQRVVGGDMAYYEFIFDGVSPNTCYAKDRYVFLLHPAKCYQRVTINLKLHKIQYPQTL